MSYISHHGILGQKWGNRNGPPYPLGGGDYTAAEKKLSIQKDAVETVFTIRSISTKFSNPIRLL